MTLRSDSRRYTNLDGGQQQYNERTPWYWRLIALVASWLILGGYLILPGLYHKNPELKISQSILSVFVVAMLTAGYSFTGLLCFVCPNDVFQAENIFLPALTSSGLGLLTIAYNFLASRSYTWSKAAITGTAISGTSTVLYTFLLLWTQRRIIQHRDQVASLERHRSAVDSWSHEPTFYTNFLQNTYPSAFSSNTQPQNEDDIIKANMQSLLQNSRDSGPSPDATSATFRIDLPGVEEEERRQANSSELLGSPPLTATHQAEWNRVRALGEDEAFRRWDRGRTIQRPASVETLNVGARERGLSREERRREIELGRI
ncbi:hypothetical protein M011DRAFT_398559 [Sporormia fimetaria CBS 119925]|uniref:Uncharacterized protein n=1 Tax=Sporormia fimetaria CBS 119925 TaxID=1340428 RepID=A0A6A6VJ16_9PLEO|nr:hypothetical protein M011DRAFT_398559 [Sporormia fimetaria CBS 119925]